MPNNRCNHTFARPRLAALFASLLMVGACNLTTSELSPSLSEAEETTQFVTVPLRQSWVHAPGAVVVTERGLVDSMEQRIGLANQTTIPGDNMITLRARALQGQMLGRFRYEEFLRRVGGLPVPFTALKSGDLSTGEDELGTYLWAESRSGANTICVLGLRRLDTGMEQMPGGTNVVDMLMRNCVNGTVEQALAPMMATTIANIAAAGAAPTAQGIQMLSPLAGPTP